MKNLMDFSSRFTPIYWAVGFGLMFGVSAGGFIGTPSFVRVRADIPAGGYPAIRILYFPDGVLRNSRDDRIRSNGGAH